MKKILLLLLALPLLFAATSCDSDNDLPDVMITVNYRNAVDYNDVLYVVQGDTLMIDSVGVQPATPNGKATQILGVSYRLNGWLVANNPIPPFGVAIPTDSLTPSAMVLSMQMPVLQIDKTPGTAYIKRRIQLVGSESELPVPADSVTRAQPQLTIVSAELQES